MHHQFGSPHLRMSLCNRKLDPLILSNRATKHNALLSVGVAFLDEPFRIADAFRGDQNALGVHPREHVANAFALSINSRRDLDIVEEHFRGGVVHHGADRAMVSPFSSPAACRG